MMTAYMGVKLWAKSVIKAGTSDVSKVLETADDISILGPSGMLYVDKKTHHVWKPMHIAKINDKQVLESVWFSKIPIAPTPYPNYRTQEQWKRFIDNISKN